MWTNWLAGRVPEGRTPYTSQPRSERILLLRKRGHYSNHNLGNSTNTSTNTNNSHHYLSSSRAYATHTPYPTNDGHTATATEQRTRHGRTKHSHYYASVWSVVFEPDVEEKLHALPAETMTDMPHCIYPEGLYCALKTMSAIGHPLYVTENGVADADDTRRRCACVGVLWGYLVVLFFWGGS